MPTIRIKLIDYIPGESKRMSVRKDATGYDCVCAQIE